MPAIDKTFDQPGLGFVLLREGYKDRPIEVGWQIKQRTYDEASAHNGNIGIIAGSRYQVLTEDEQTALVDQGIDITPRYIGLDKDQPRAFDGLELPPTTTWETRPGRLGMFFKCSDVTPELLAKYGLKPHQAQLKLRKDGEDIGEIKLERQYQCIPPSWKTLSPEDGGNRVDYLPLDMRQPAEVSLEKLLADLDNLGIVFSKHQTTKPPARTKDGQPGKKQQSKQRVEENVVLTTLAKLSDGRILEQIGTPGKYQFAIWDGKTVSIAPEVEHAGLKYQPRIIDPMTKGFILFPTAAEEYTNTTELIEEIETFLHKYIDVSPTFLMIAARYIVMTYVYDRLESLCYLRALSDLGGGKSRILASIGHCCYKPILTTGSTSAAAISRILNLIPGTLVIDEADIYESSESNQLVKVLNTGHSKRCGILKCNTNDPSEVDSVPSYGPKILATRNRWKDVALESRCITEMCEPSDREDLTINLPAEFFEGAEHIRNKLLLWRFHNYQKVTGMEADAIKLDHVDPRIKQSWSCLAYVVTQSKEDLKKFKAAMLRSEEDMVEQNSRRWEGQILKVYKDMHDKGNRNITPAQLAERIEEEFHYPLVKPESVGKTLAGLNIARERKTQGMVIVHDEKKMNKLYNRYIPGHKLHLVTVQENVEYMNPNNQEAVTP